jgi:hypothetical protein
MTGSKRRTIFDFKSTPSDASKRSIILYLHQLNKQIIMKNLILLFTCSLILSSCSSGSDSSDNNNPDSKKTGTTFVLPKSDTENGLEVNTSDSTILWNFKTFKYWTGYDAYFTSKAITIVNGQLNFLTHAGTAERPKVRTLEQKYTYGEYTWRVYIPMPGVGDRTSVGAFLYYDDQHEVDFEIGYGTIDKRQELNATKNDIVLYMTSQDLPHKSEQCLLTANKWYTLSMKLTNVNGKYKIAWYVDGSLKMLSQMTFGSEVPFYIFCSLENLNFIGDRASSQDNTCIFDYVKYRYAAMP